MSSHTEYRMYAGQQTPFHVHTDVSWPMATSDWANPTRVRLVWDALLVTKVSKLDNINVAIIVNLPDVLAYVSILV